MTFLLPENLSPTAEAAVRRACLAGGYDQNPVPTRLELTPGRLTVSREVSESGYLLLPWPIDPFGYVITTTATLRERPEPYGLLVELARGKLNQVRSQTVEWQSLGLRTAPEYDAELRRANQLFGRAALCQPTPESHELAVQALNLAHVLADRLVKLYTEQVFETRHADEGPLATQFTARLYRPLLTAHVNEYRQTFNTIQVPFRWCDLEPAESDYNWTVLDQTIASAKATGLPLRGGPILDLAPGLVPPWAAGWEGDLPTLAAFMCDFLETVLNRYRGSIRRWQICAGFNHCDAYGLTDDDRLRLAARLFDAASQVDPELDLVLGISQPWGDYLLSDEQTIPPFQFADDLIRSGLRVSAVELEIGMGFSPRGSWPRDLLETCRIVDLFGLLGLPIEISLSTPSSPEPDAIASLHGQSLTGHPGLEGPSLETQAQWGEAFAALALCKPHVRAVTWAHWSDASPHLAPHAGLVTFDGRTKPLLPRLRTIRSAHLT